MTGRGARMAVPEEDTSSSGRGAAESAVSQGDLEQAVRHHLHSFLSARHKRRRYFGERLFAEPAWDILLHLYAAELETREGLPVSALAGAVQVPASTALRWIHALKAEGLVAWNTLRANPCQAPVNLSKAGRMALDSYFRDIAAASLQR